MAVTLNNVRFSYCNLFQAKAGPGQAEAKYSVTILVPKSNTAAKALMDREIAAAMDQGVSSKWNGQRPPQPAVCVHDGDGTRPSDGMPFGEECHGCWVFTASSREKPFVVDAQVNDILDPREVYSGIWGNVSVNFFPYNFSGKKGIGCGLNGIQKTADGEPLSGRVTAREAFQPVAPAASAAPAAAPWGGTPVSAPWGGEVNPFTGQPV